MSSIKWLPLESNPDVMNKFLANLGVPAYWGISDVVSMDEELIDMIPVPSLALLLLFPITNKYTEYCEKQELQKENQQDGVYYMKQTIRNGCGTIALIHAIANNESKLDLQADSVLKKFIDSTKDLSPEERGKVLEQNLVISAMHDSSAQEGQTEAPNLDDEVNLHFIAIVNVNGKLVVLDKRKISCSYAGCFCAACIRAVRLAVNFVMRRTSPVAEFRRAPGESYNYRRRPPSRSRSGRKMKGRGNVRYRTPESSDERSGSETPPHWRQEQSRLKDVIPKKDNGPSDEISVDEDYEEGNSKNPFLQSRLGAMSSKNSGNLRNMYV